HEFLKSLKLDVKELLNAQGLEKLRLVDVFTNAILENEKTRQQYLELAGNAHKYYKAVLPEPRAEDYYQEVTAYKVIASRIREVIDQEADVTQVKKDLEDLLDRSIHAGEYVIKD